MLKFWPLFPRKPFANLMEFYKSSTIYTSVIQFHPFVGHSLRNTPLTVFAMELNLSIMEWNGKRASRINISCKWKSEKAKVIKVSLQRQRRCSTSWPSTHLLLISQIYIFTSKKYDLTRSITSITVENMHIFSASQQCGGQRWTLILSMLICERLLPTAQKKSTVHLKGLF